MTNQKKHQVKNKSSGFWGKMIFLYLFWLLLSWDFDLQHLIVGAMVAFLITSLSKNFLLTAEECSLLTFTNFYYFILFFFILTWEMVKANLKVAYIIFHPKLPISPGIVQFQTKLKTDLAKVALANSITLTPGTLSVDIEGDMLTIHGLTQGDLESVQENSIEKILMKIEGGASK